jgi:hypothetical protein
LEGAKAVARRLFDTYDRDRHAYIYIKYVSYISCISVLNKGLVLFKLSRNLSIHKHTFLIFMYYIYLDIKEQLHLFKDASCSKVLLRIIYELRK